MLQVVGQLFPCDLCEVLQNGFLPEHCQVTAFINEIVSAWKYLISFNHFPSPDLLDNDKVFYINATISLVLIDVWGQFDISSSSSPV